MDSIMRKLMRPVDARGNRVYSLEDLAFNLVLVVVDLK